MFENINLKERLREAISLAWFIFSQKVGNGLIDINKEASMQLQYSYILQKLLPLIIFKPGEEVKLELETDLKTNIGIRTTDIFLVSKGGKETNKTAIEMKCYKTKTSTGGKRGAQDIFKKDVYFDLYLLEKYWLSKNVNNGICLVMTDYRSYIYPKNKDTKSWIFDISEGAKYLGGKLEESIGGKFISIELKKKYYFHWNNIDEYWFLEIEGTLN